MVDDECLLGWFIMVNKLPKPPPVNELVKSW